MATECDIHRCGLPAIGRCQSPTCAVPGGAAFCFSHQYGGRCTQCLRADDGCEKAVRAAIEALQARIRGIARALVLAGVRPDECYAEGTVSKEVRVGLFGSRTRTVTVSDPAGDRYGWLLGRYPWRVTSRAYDGHESTYTIRLRTYLTANGDLAAEGDQTGTINDGSRYPYLRGDAEIRFWEALAAAAAEIAERYGVSEPA